MSYFRPSVGARRPVVASVAWTRQAGPVSLPILRRSCGTSRSERERPFPCRRWFHVLQRARGLGLGVAACALVSIRVKTRPATEQPPGGGRRRRRGRWPDRTAASRTRAPRYPSAQNVLARARRAVGIDFDSAVEQRVDYASSLPDPSNVARRRRRVGHGSRTQKSTAARGCVETLIPEGDVGDGLNTPDAGRENPNPDHQYSSDGRGPAGTRALRLRLRHAGDGSVRYFADRRAPVGARSGRTRGRVQDLHDPTQRSARALSSGGRRRRHHLLSYRRRPGPTTQTSITPRAWPRFRTNSSSTVETYFGSADV